MCLDHTHNLHHNGECHNYKTLIITFFSITKHVASYKFLCGAKNWQVAYYIRVYDNHNSDWSTYKVLSQPFVQFVA